MLSPMTRVRSGFACLHFPCNGEVLSPTRGSSRLQPLRSPFGGHQLIGAESNDGAGDGGRGIYRRTHGPRAHRRRRGTGRHRQHVERRAMGDPERRAFRAGRQRRLRDGCAYDREPQGGRGHPFRGAADHSAVLRRPARILPRQYGQEPHAPVGRAESRHQALHLLVDGRGVWQSSR